MIPTILGAVLVLVALPLIAVGGTGGLLALFIACGPISGSAAFYLPALSASITPMHFSLGLLLLRMGLASNRRSGDIGEALRANWRLIAFAAYGAVMAYIGPRLFAHMIDLPPLRTPRSSDLFLSFPLAPSTQNLTTAIYTLGSAASAVAAYFMLNTRDNWRIFVSASVWVGWTNVILGILSVVGRGTPIDLLLTVFRNGLYAQLSQDYQGFVRMTGVFPEASAYAGYTFCWFCFIFECWFRNVMPRRTGPLALAMFVILLISTSGTAYVGLTMFLSFTGLRLIPWSASQLHSKVVTVIAVGLAGLVLVTISMAILPGFAVKFGSMITHMTFDKSSSSSGLQRTFQMRKGLEAFVASYGLGVGPGSFRSSGLLFAILGSLGVVGFVLYMLNMLAVWMPWRRSTFMPVDDAVTSVGIAAAWAALLNLFPAGVSASSSDFGLTTGLLTGVALALRKLSSASPRVNPATISDPAGPTLPALTRS